jgi:DNA-binding NtrC family response regulator/polyferredoxin/pSer/pThr/pTyr-binding forkhead associated (FHA) protein
MKELTPFPMKNAPAPPGGPPDGSLDATRLDASGFPPGSAGLSALLEVVQGDASRPFVTLGTAPVRMGRAASNDLVLNDDGVSRSHAEVRWENGTYVIHDLDSSNGTRVDDVKVRSLPLAPGARIGLGGIVLKFSQASPEVAEADRLALMEKSDLLQALETPTRTAAARLMTVRFVPRGGIVLKQAAPMEGILFVHRGRLRVVEVNDEGGERVVARIETGDHFGERALVASVSAPQTLAADVDSCVLELTRSALEGLLLQQPDQSQALAGTVRLKLRTAQKKATSPPPIPGAAARKDDLDDVVTSTEVVIVGEDKKVQRVKERLAGFGKDNLPVLILGPQGSGKRTFARHYHNSGPHKGQPYVEMSVADPGPGGAGAAIFGLEPQAGSPAKGQAGYLEMVGEGTLAIVHAEMLDPHLQALLAGYLKLGWFHRLQGQGAVQCKTRVLLLATGDEPAVLERLVPELRELLAKRTAAVPPLAQRRKDIPLLADHFLKASAQGAGRRALPLSREAVDKLVSYSWPGNVRELENVMQRAAIVTAEDSIIPGDLIFVAQPEKEIHKINLLRNERFRSFLRHPRLMKTLLWADLVFVVGVLAVTLYGGTRPAGDPLNAFATNPGMLVTWVIWFPALPVTAFLIGRAWCGVCPIAFAGDLAGKVKRYNLPVPKILKRLDFWLLAFSFILIDYVEELFGVADKPIATATLLLVLVYMAVAMTVLWERKTFCKHVCPLAGVLGAYSSMSMFEIRGNKKVCQTQCGEHTCYKGTASVDGCPLFSYPASMNMNAECMMCLNCLKSCDNRGVQLNLRPPLTEIWQNGQTSLAVSVFGVILVGMMAKHQFPKLTSWIATQQRLGWSDGFTHTVLYFGFILLAVAAFSLAATLSAAASREGITRNMATYGVAFIPLALSAHVAHLTHEILGEKLYLLLAYPVKLFDSVFKGIPIAGSTAQVAPFVPAAVVTFLKFLIVAGGVTGCAVALLMVARRVSKETVFARALPHLLLAGAFSMAYLMIFTGATGEPPPPAPVAAPTAPVAAPVGPGPKAAPGNRRAPAAPAGRPGAAGRQVP